MVTVVAVAGVRPAVVVGVMVVAVTRRFVVPEAAPVPVREMPAPDRVPVIVTKAGIPIITKAGIPIITKAGIPIITAPLAAALTLGLCRTGRKREVSIRIERQDHRRRREHKAECPGRCGGA